MTQVASQIGTDWVKHSLNTNDKSYSLPTFSYPLVPILLLSSLSSLHFYSLLWSFVLVPCLAGMLEVTLQSDSFHSEEKMLRVEKDVRIDFSIDEGASGKTGSGFVSTKKSNVRPLLSVYAISLSTFSIYCILLLRPGHRDHVLIPARLQPIHCRHTPLYCYEQEFPRRHDQIRHWKIS